MQLLVLVASLFLTGGTTVGALGLQKGRTTIEWITLSLSFGALVLPVATFALGRILGGLPPMLPYLVLTIFGAGFAFTYLRERGRRPRLVVGRLEVFAILLAVGNAAVVGYYFTKYPVFPPELLFHDYLLHLQASTAPNVLLYGWLTNSLYGLTQITSYLYLGYGLVAVGGLQIEALRYSMLVLGFFFPLLVYYASLKISHDEAAALFATAAYCFIMPFWDDGLLTSGLYGEFYVGVIGLLFAWMLAESLGERVGSANGLFALFLSGAALVFAHVTSLMELLAGFVYATAFGAWLKIRSWKFWLFVAAFPVAAIIAALAAPEAIASFLSSVASPGGVLVSASGLPGGPFAPFLYTLDGSIGDVPLIFLLVTLGVFIARTAVSRKMKVVHSLPVVWFLIPLLASGFFGGAYAASRYSFYALVPAALVFGLGYLYIVRPIEAWLIPRTSTSRRANARVLYAAVVILLIAVLSVQGATGGVLSSAAFERDFISAKQTYVLDSMNWIGSSTPRQSVIFSVGLPWYWFSPYVDGRQFATDDIGTPGYMSQQISAWFASNPAELKAPVYLVMFSLLRNSSGLLSNAYGNDSRFTLVFQNPMVLVFSYNSSKQQ